MRSVPMRLSILLHFGLVLVSGFTTQLSCATKGSFLRQHHVRFSSPSSDTEATKNNELDQAAEKHAAYIRGLVDNLTNALDRWIITGSSVKETQARNILQEIQQHCKDGELLNKAVRLAQRAGLVEHAEAEIRKSELGKTDAARRATEAAARSDWEKFRNNVEEVGALVGKAKASSGNKPRSALTSRMNKGEQDLFMGVVDDRLTKRDQDEIIDGEKIEKAIQDAEKVTKSRQDKLDELERDEESCKHYVSKEAVTFAQAYASDLVAKSGNMFDGETLGIGGLDDVLAQVKRRVWVPLAAPPILLHELGISPVRGLLLYGSPGCGKTLIARTIGRILSPARPVSVVSGPELMDKFVGSSEKNLRELFDNPPPVYDPFRLEGGKGLDTAALHVIVMDEFDAMARTRGGGGGKEQGDAGVARDSVVNQLLAKMDGVDPLPVPTLVIGLTNRRSLIEPALLRPGRFEVQIEVPPPKTQAQRISILKVHMRTMHEAGRLLVRDGPPGSPSEMESIRLGREGTMSYDELLDHLATQAEGMSGASIAAIARAAASHALERAVTSYSNSANKSGVSMFDCVVSRGDFELALEDVKASSGNSDSSDDEDKSEQSDKLENTNSDTVHDGESKGAASGTL